MANSDSIDPTEPPLRLESELQLEMNKRKAWFFECQLRKLTLEHFRDVEVNEESPDSRINLISESPPPVGPIGSRAITPGQSTSTAASLYGHRAKETNGINLPRLLLASRPIG